ncbi:MAG TPA: SpoIID/LytB domain-containing protein [Candidatus Acidoferrales bacterium]|nr:SpoIID/LytB domain-containing protein [Candidatus Acidoferrales bacterium]
MRRREFLALTAAAAYLPGAAQPDDDVDPATSAAVASLRVLLGAGVAQPVAGSDGFLFDGRPYRGSFERLADGRIVNVVGLEAYLYSVVPHEMTSSWPAPALAAQAVCARTYVLQRSNPRRDYDVVPSQMDQVYPGVTGETPAGRAAVDATAGQVLRFGGMFATVAYSSCCGGHTESAADAWGGAGAPYLGGVVCRYCTDSPYYRWQASVAMDDIAQRFSEQLDPIGALQNVVIGSRDASGRARDVTLVAQRGSVDVKGTAFRLGVGARVVRSLLISDARVDQPELFLEGGGLGHGVGMCQWGARGMALAGHTARDILALYFPGTETVHD